jgi:hypothetical protein
VNLLTADESDELQKRIEEFCKNLCSEWGLGSIAVISTFQNDENQTGLISATAGNTFAIAASIKTMAEDWDDSIAVQRALGELESND